MDVVCAQTSGNWQTINLLLKIYILKFLIILHGVSGVSEFCVIFSATHSHIYETNPNTYAKTTLKWNCRFAEPIHSRRISN